MEFRRAAGILLHPTSLPGKYGIGDLGPEAFEFIDFLTAAGQRLWQVFPLGPTGYGDSPYQCFSAFAGNPLLISPDVLVAQGFLSEDDLKGAPDFEADKIDYGPLIQWKKGLLGVAFQGFKSFINSGSAESKSVKTSFNKFCKANSSWLDDYALFMAAKEHHGGGQWTSWEPSIALRKPKELGKWKKKLAEGIEFQKFQQFCFFDQWLKVKEYANSKNIQIIGDLPIFVAYDSADVWANKELFTVDEEGKLIWVAGVPPDYFSPTGQLWGNPLYRWDEMEKDDFAWWRGRIAALLNIVDIIRIDHFRGFQAYWRIPGGAPTAEKGKWIKAPGMKFFRTVKEYLGEVPIIAEDLGVITPPVEKLRDAFNFPGIKIMQFAFGTGMEAKFLPHNYIRNCVVHTGSHDNDTTRGYFDSVRLDKSDIYEFAQNYLNCYKHEAMVAAAIKAAYASVANTVVIPMQDVLNLGNSARMNFPGKLGGNWSWRAEKENFTDDLAAYFNYMTKIYERGISSAVSDKEAGK
ncbi:MAG: 4-alpha-glucanotransferase [Ignavibacteriales bacterium]|nr:MAG: 4-alpha-glucanotransferase [Ignavibacteriaceae bacterium]MBW7873162.1 4-alpha-glucanotransferase [Ignavibacteria bacterium]MCZ2142804.1 4-alpha-glucanotransferase [Ignavibacteriales bacterium]MBV6443898.1 4-alpha-glucanotransferase [Ignavibacteriaceae bacterium]MBZ0196259.1 4-alpha-glucanotransferase [Ignavibacteriaceae bacterium]